MRPAFAFFLIAGCSSNAQLNSTLVWASLADDRIQRRHAGVVGVELRFCDILRGILHASFFAVITRIFHVAAVLHALEYVQ